MTGGRIWSWAGIVAVILAIGVSTALILLAWQAVSGDLAEPVSTILSSSLGAAIGAVGGYIGGVSRPAKAEDDSR